MAPFNEPQLTQAKELLQQKSGTKDILAELTTLAQTEKIARSEVPEIITALQTTIDALKMLLKPESSESAMASEWAKTIKESGTCIAYGKVNPQLFDGTPGEKITPRNEKDDYAYPMLGLGHIGYIPQQMVHAYPSLSPISGELTGMGMSIYKSKSRQNLFLSAPITPNDEYNVKMLRGRFNEPYREIRLFTFIPGSEQTTYRTGEDEETPFQLVIHLPSDVAEKIFDQMTSNPADIQALIENFYPNSKLLNINIAKLETKFFKLESNPQEKSDTRRLLSSLLS